MDHMVYNCHLQKANGTYNSLVRLLRKFRTASESEADAKEAESDMEF